MKLATWNVNSIRARIDILGAWLLRQQPDILCLQETKVVDDLFPFAPIAAAGYRAVVVGERTYNGVAILSRDPVEDVQIHFPLDGNNDCRLISAVFHGFRVYSAYFPNGRDPATEHYINKLKWIDGLSELLFGQGASQLPIA